MWTNDPKTRDVRSKFDPRWLFERFIFKNIGVKKVVLPNIAEATTKSKFALNQREGLEAKQLT